MMKCAWLIKLTDIKHKLSVYKKISTKDGVITTLAKFEDNKTLQVKLASPYSEYNKNRRTIIEVPKTEDRAKILSDLYEKSPMIIGYNDENYLIELN